MNNFKELKVWQQSVDLVVDIYQLTRQFPSQEMYGLTSQIRRSSINKIDEIQRMITGLQKTLKV